MNTNFLANTQGQLLEQHLKAVAIRAREVCNANFKVNQETLDECFLAGLIHDIGKVDPGFQNWCKKKLGSQEEFHNEEKNKTFEETVRHNELSWAIARNLSPVPKPVLYAVLWHHAKKFRGNGKVLSSYDDLVNSYGKNQYANILNTAQNLLFANLQWLKVANIFKADLSYVDSEDVKLDGFRKTNVDALSENVHNSIIRYSLITADREVSSWAPKQLNSFLEDSKC